MLAHDVIVIENLPERVENSIINQSVNYALLSISYTYNRMEIPLLATRIQNIAKGKMAEFMFHHFMTQNKLDVNFSSCQTPFYLPDKRDFIMGEYEWDQKNNFIRCNTSPTADEIIELPALIPNSLSTGNFKDQWQQRLIMKHPTSKGARFVFTFMERPVNGELIKVTVHEGLGKFFERIKKEFPRGKDTEAPFTESWFWNELSGADFPQYKITQPLRLYITSWAGEEHFRLFFNTEKRNFDEMIFTKIRNKTLKVHHLPAFSLLFPSLKRAMKCGRFMVSEHQKD